MKTTLIIGLGIQGNKRKKVLNKLKIKVKTIDPFNLKADYKSVQDLSEKFLKNVSHIFICTPFSHRIEYINFFKNYDIKFLIEKPLIISEREKIFFIKNKNKLKNKIYVSYNHRFEKCINLIKTKLKKKKIGKIYFAEMTYGNGTAKDIKNSMWKNKGDAVINDLMPHLLDLNNYLFGKIPKYSKFSLKKSFENKSADYFNILTNVKNIKLNIKVSYLFWKNFFKIYISGSRGFISLNGLPKWGECNLTYGKRIYPSGKPLMKIYNFKPIDFTWKKEMYIFLKNKFKPLDLKKNIEIYNFIKKC